MSDNINGKDFVVGTIIGGVLGAGIALLFAPKSGKEIRGNLNNGAEQVKNRAYELKNNATQLISPEWKEKAYTKGSALKQKALDSTSQLTKAVIDKTQELQNAVQNKL